MFRIRTITAFVILVPSDFDPRTKSTDGNETNTTSGLQTKIEACHAVLQDLRNRFEAEGYDVQTVRISTNPFEEWLLEDATEDSSNSQSVIQRLSALDAILQTHDIQFCSLGPSHDPSHTRVYCPLIVEHSPRFCCSADVRAADVEAAHAAADCIRTISALRSHDYLEGGLGNFRFCAAASCRDFIPFFPGSKCCRSKNGDDDIIKFAVGLENGKLAHHLLSKAKSLTNISTVFRQGMVDALSPLERICRTVADTNDTYTYLGIDSSLNPSLDEGGSVAAAIETLEEVRGNFGGSGTLAAAACITTALQSLDRDHKITLTGYCGLMLPLLEDERLAELKDLKISQLLSISSVCGVGVDTVPLPGECPASDISSLILDVAGLAGRWDKSLSCRVFPVPGLERGGRTMFDSPYLCNSRVMDLS